MTNEQLQAYLDFVSRHRKKLGMIARHTNGEHSREDVANEVWIVAQALAEAGTHIDFRDAPGCELLWGHLYNRLVRYTEKNIRHGIRLDHSTSADDVDAVHPMLRKLAADDGNDPLSLLIASQSANQEPIEPGPCHSRATSYLWLLRQFDQSMVAVAGYLLISTSWCYRCYRDAQILAERQWPMPAFSGMGDTKDTFKPWRAFRIRRETMQLSLPFDDSFDFWPQLKTNPLPVATSLSDQLACSSNNPPCVTTSSRARKPDMPTPTRR